MYLFVKKFFCKIGLHWMSNHASMFWDGIGGCTVYGAKCTCGKEWMTETTCAINLNPFNLTVELNNVDRT